VAPSALDRVELCVIGGERFTNGTTTGEPDYLACNFSYKNADVPGKPFLPKGTRSASFKEARYSSGTSPLYVVSQLWTCTCAIAAASRTSASLIDSCAYRLNYIRGDAERIGIHKSLGLLGTGNAAPCCGGNFSPVCGPRRLPFKLELRRTG